MAPMVAGFHVAQPGEHCPDYHVNGEFAICLYDANNFNFLLGWADQPPSCASGWVIDLPAVTQNKTNSVRNRTNCGIFLQYYVSGIGYIADEWMRPLSEDGVITPTDAIDRLAT